MFGATRIQFDASSQALFGEQGLLFHASSLKVESREKATNAQETPACHKARVPKGRVPIIIGRPFPLRAPPGEPRRHVLNLCRLPLGHVLWPAN